VHELASILGCEVIARIPSLAGEPTGHADMLAQFVSRDRAIVVALDPEQNPVDAVVVDTAARALSLAAAALGRPLQIIRVPALFVDGELFSFVNGTRIGERFLTPWFEQVPEELHRRAYRALSDAMPGVDLVRVPADGVLESAGAVHCITLGLSLPRSGESIVDGSARGR
jgi:agmatine/peptidylarginine deiminase